jgi:hypothetical protein
MCIEESFKISEVEASLKLTLEEREVFKTSLCNFFKDFLEIFHAKIFILTQIFGIIIYLL